MTNKKTCKRRFFYQKNQTIAISTYVHILLCTHFRSQKIDLFTTLSSPLKWTLWISADLKHGNASPGKFYYEKNLTQVLIWCYIFAALTRFFGKCIFRSFLCKCLNNMMSLWKREIICSVWFKKIGLTFSHNNLWNLKKV